MSPYLKRDTHRLPSSGKVMKILRIRTYALNIECSSDALLTHAIFCSWEPFKSFENCGEDIIERFWERVDTKGRDVNSIEGWTNGEEVYPIGPPRTLPYPKNHPGSLLSVEAERAGRHPRKMRLPMLHHRRMGVLYREGLRMARRQRDR